MKKWLSLFLLLFSFCHHHIIHAQSHQDLWHIIQKDTFPFLYQFENINRTAETTLKELNTYFNQDTEEYNTAFRTTFLYQVLASKWDIADSLIIISQKNAPSITNELLASKLFIDYQSCPQNSDSTLCATKKNNLLHFLKTTSISSQPNEAMKWYWVSKMLEDKSKKNNLFTPITLLPSQLNPAQYPGAIVATERNLLSTNLLISNGYRQNIQLLELNKKGQWEDVTSASKLENIPGGHRLYAIDINNDGYQDLMIVRKNIHLNKEYLYPSILINQKDGTYKDISSTAGFNVPQRANCVCFLDANKDKKLDIFIGNEGYNSLLFIQDENLKFKESSKLYGIITSPNHIVDCWVADINQDNNEDLLLSTFKGPNYAYIFKKIEQQYPFFINQSQNKELAYPYSGGQFIVGDFDGNLSQNIISNTNFSPDKKDIIFNMLIGKYRPDEYPLMWTLDTMSQEHPIQQYPLLSYAKTSVNIDNGESKPYILFGGGIEWDEYYPIQLYQYQNNQLLSENFQLDNPPNYIHSIGITPNFKTQQPVIWMKGGNNYPLLKETIASYLQNNLGGKFYQIILEGKERNDALGAKIIVTTQNIKGQETRRMRIIQAIDSQGNGAGQNLWFIPKDNKLIEIEITWPDKSVQTIKKFKAKNQIIKIQQESI
ncbi:MAG: VCBS repeat-containing protein [Chitinophagales bacterium]|nr:VCBS repeat-containing protein [Chitinophagales bacterium]